MSRPRRSIIAAIISFLTAILFAAPPASAEEAIERLHADISIARNGTLHVVETYRVHAEGDQIRHGIYRDVSTTFEDADKTVHRVGFKLISLTRDGLPEPYHTERYSDFLRIYAGDADVFLNSGTYLYVLTYETDRQIRWFDEKPELFWNVTGNAWAFPILDASASLTLPDKVAPVKWTAYTGGLNARGTDFQGAVVGGTLKVQTTHRLEPGEGLSIVAEIPATAVDKPSGAQGLYYFLLDYAEWIIGIAGLIIVFVYYLWAWNKVGRDPKGGTIIPLFHPPEGVSAALSSYIRNWGFGTNAWKSFTASALALAVRGLIVFDQQGKDLILERSKPTDDAVRNKLPASERAVLDWVNSQGGRAEINKKNGKAVAKVGTSFQSGVKAEAGDRYFRYNLLYFAGGILLSLLTVGAVVLFGGLSHDELGLLIGMLILGVFLTLFIVPIIKGLLDGKGLASVIFSLISLAIMLGVVVHFLAGFARDQFGSMGGMMHALASALHGHTFPFMLMLVMPLVNGIFWYLLRAPTPEGRPVMDQIEGFRMYLETAESGRLNIANAPEITAQRFEALLPFAVALGVERPWANAFAAALARAHPGESDPMSYYRPGWRRGGSWSSNDFGRSISTAVASATSAASSAIPRSSSSSSGFSGGSGSGGGGGGRGGGGW